MKTHNLLNLPLVCGVLLALVAGYAIAQEAPKTVESQATAKRPATQFLRVERDDEDQPKTLQTSVVSYKAAEGDGDLVVDLVGAVHVGDKAYYDELNKRFDDYDVVLYELVAPKDNAVPQRGAQRGDNPVSLLQNMTKSILGLESQTEHIDYTKENFVHADLSPEEMQEGMKKRGEDGLTLALGVMTDMLRQANLAEQKAAEGDEDVVPADPFALLLDPQRSLKLKRMMAESFAGEDALEGGLGQTLQRMLIDDRNAAAMKVFQKELAKGRKRIAFFYGAAHMGDFEKRLMVDFGLKPTKTEWVTAWRMTGGDMGGRPADPLQELLKLLQEATR